MKAGTATTAGIARKVGNTCSRRDFNSSRKGSNSGNTNHSRDSSYGDSRDETTAVTTTTEGLTAAQKTTGTAEIHRFFCIKKSVLT
jgi:hypothetical protein